MPIALHLSVSRRYRNSACIATAFALIWSTLGLTAAATASHAPGTSCSTGRDLRYDGHMWDRPVEYFVIRSSLPSSERRRQDRLIARVRDAAGTWNRGKNDCHSPVADNFNTAFQGDSGSSYSDHRDNRTTFDFAAGTTCDSDVRVACAHVRDGSYTLSDTYGRTRRVAREADVRFNSDFRFYSGVKSPCSGCYHLWGVAAHEWGHIVGLDDIAGARNEYQTMYQDFSAGESYRLRSLGRSDWLGLYGLYGR